MVWQLLSAHSLNANSLSRLRHLVLESMARDLHLTVCCCLGKLFWGSTPFFSSFSTVLRQVSFGRPQFLFSCGVHCRAILGRESCDMRQTCPSHHHRHILTVSWIESIPVLLSSSSLEMMFGQNILRIRFEQLFWNISFFKKEHYTVWFQKQLSSHPTLKWPVCSVHRIMISLHIPWEVSLTSSFKIYILFISQ